MTISNNVTSTATVTMTLTQSLRRAPCVQTSASLCCRGRKKNFKKSSLSESAESLSQGTCLTLFSGINLPSCYKSVSGNPEADSVHLLKSTQPFKGQGVLRKSQLTDREKGQEYGFLRWEINGIYQMHTQIPE